MATPAQIALAEGFVALDEVHGQPCTIGVASIVARVASLPPDDPRLQGSTDRLVEIRISPANRPAELPKRGDELDVDSVTYRVAGEPAIDRSTGEVVIPAAEA
jgi:hypothetical protein